MFPSLLGSLASAYSQENMRQLHPFLQVLFRATYMLVGLGGTEGLEFQLFSSNTCKVK